MSRITARSPCLPLAFVGLLVASGVAQKSQDKKPATQPSVRISNKDAIREATGIELSTFAADLRRRMRGEKERKGLLVGDVDESTPGARAGFKKGDVLLTWDKKPVTSVGELARWIRDAAQARVVVEFRRKGRGRGEKKWRTEKTKIELGQPGIRQAFGITFAVVESMIRRNIISTDTPYGFKIKRVDKGSVADAAGLRKGDLVMKWDGAAVYKIVQIRKWLAKAKPGAKVTVHYSRRKEKAKLFDRKPWKNAEVTLALPGSKKK